MEIVPRLRRLAKSAVGWTMVAVGTALAGAGRRSLLAIHSRERTELPEPLSVGGVSLDVLDDLAAYTTLERRQVEELVRRRHDTFRLEWHLLQPRPRNETWYYLSSRLYLFGNAVHVHEEPWLVDLLRDAVPPGGRVLEFGGGTGNLALALATGGLDVDYLELSALQKDFVRFRARRHGLDGRVRVLDSWDELPRGRYNLVCAFDVLEHLPHLRHEVEQRLVPALAPGGTLAERSPFVCNFANPMHHEDDEGLDALLARAGLALVRQEDGVRLWRRGG